MTDKKSALENGSIPLRQYQQETFDDHESGIVVLHWARQIGKSHTLAAWAVRRLLTYPGRLVTVLSNSKENGAEFLLKCAGFCHENFTPFKVHMDVPPLEFEDYRMELRLRNEGRLGRIKVLAANPRTARGFSGDLILDEFAFHDDCDAIWEAVEPILSANPDFQCRIASTGNGRFNLFYRMVASGAFKVNRVTRTMAHAMGTPIYHPHTRERISPGEARAAALNKRAYDQNYECAFADENLALLTHELITAAERDDVGEICRQDWTPSALERMRQSAGPLYAGFDVGRKVDLSVITVIEKTGGNYLVRGILQMRDMRLPDQESRLGEICGLPRFQCAAIDMTGLGLGLCEYAQKTFGRSRIRGINFAGTTPIRPEMRIEGRKQETVRVTEAMAVGLLRVYEDRRIQHPRDAQLRDDLRKPEKVTGPTGRVSIAATRDESGHADHFWSFALAIEVAATSGSFGCQSIPRPFRPLYPNRSGAMKI